jgi:hypothetical protein
MNNEPKIQLSGMEQSLMSNAEWILTKNGIIEKLKLLLQQCLVLQQPVILQNKKRLPQQAVDSSPKISRGENYKGLPWLMLDYPRVFEKENIFAIRTLFWWGNYFSMTLHLSGIYKNEYAERIKAAFEILGREQYWYCINDDEWEHYFTEDNYQLIAGLSKQEFSKLVNEKKFIKLSKQFELSQWQDLPLLSSDSLKLLIKILDQLPSL